jgi:hypothetical protein
MLQTIFFREIEMTTKSKWTRQVSVSLSFMTAALISACGGGFSENTSATSTAPAPVATEQPVSDGAQSEPTTPSTEEAAPAPETTPAPAPAPATEPTPTPAPAPEAAPAPAPEVTPPAANLRAPAFSTPAPTAPSTGTSTGEATCGKGDKGGWTVPVPSKADTSTPLKSLKQPGSRLFYVSAATGTDATGEVYFWDGAQIIDSTGKPANAKGEAYGTDATNPSAAVKAFKRWAYVAPRQDGEDFGAPGRAGAPIVSTRAGYPDWWMFKRGETFDLSEDLLSYAKESNPATTSVTASLTVPGGRSATERQIVGAYGSVCAPRPRFMHPQQGFITRWDSTGFPAFKNAAYLSLHFDGHDRSKPGVYSGLTMLYQGPTSTNILFEDMWFDAATVNIGEKNGAQVTFRRSLITDNFEANGEFTQGLYYYGSREGRLRIEESILLRNGFSHGDPKLAWPPSGAQTWDHFSRNMYIHGETSNMNSAVIDSVSMLGGSGDQFRAGLRVERNFFYQGYVSMGANGGYADSEGATGTMTDNVLQRFAGSGTNSNIGQPGWGLALTSGAYNIEVARNIVTGAQHAGAGPAFGMSPLSWLCYGHVFKFATRSNNVHDNIFESSVDSAPVVASDGVTSEQSPGCAKWQYAGVKDNSVTNNVLVSSSGKVSAYDPVGAAVGTTNDTVYSGNKFYKSRTEASTAMGWNNPNRTLKTYMQATGATVTSNDGFIEYYNQAIQMRRGQWRDDLTGKAINNHIRSGFNMTSIQ